MTPLKAECRMTGKKSFVMISSKADSPSPTPFLTVIFIFFFSKIICYCWFSLQKGSWFCDRVLLNF